MKTVFDCLKPVDLREEVRKLVSDGETKREVSRKFNLKYDKVIEWTRDFRKNRVYSPQLREEVISRVNRGERKVDVANDLDIVYPTVVMWTKNVGGRKGPSGLTGRSIKILRKLIMKGYLFPCDYRTGYIANLYKVFKKYDIPVKKVTVHNRTIYFLEGREHEALIAFTGKYMGRVLDYNLLRKSARAFGVKLDRFGTKLIKNIKKGDCDEKNIESKEI